MHNFYLAPDKWHEYGESAQSSNGVVAGETSDGSGMAYSPEARQILDGPEARHLAKVLRIRPGEEIRLLDGQGRSGRFTVLNLEKNSVELAPLQVEKLPRPGNRCWLAAAYTKAARRSWLLEKSVELEAGGIWFWQAEHSQAKAPEVGKENWQDQLIAGAKQCFNPWLPELRTFPGGARQLADYAAGSPVESCSAYQPNFSRRILLWEDASEDMLLTEADFAPTPDQPGDGNTLFVMGPEGGLSAGEADLFSQSGFKCVSLGKRILRWETAALLCLGLGFWARQRLAIPQSE
ncbi:MAG: 16S rRNA (uracil(1498)-N(3))-methyltransferase [Deltaproteobacteria bacterium]|nr:16S rRNA (uracil(1498)-N(3))-methyltransferase [Deltaproteobacteria bacterium]